jgi:hypothetical protein
LRREEEEEESGVMEAVEMKKVSVTHTDGSDAGSKKGPVAANSGQAGMDSKPVKFSGASETVPTSPKAPSNYGSKGETTVKGAGQFKNTPGQDAGKSSFKEKVPGGFGHKTPQGKEAGAGGSVQQNDKSVMESRKPARRRI